MIGILKVAGKDRILNWKHSNPTRQAPFLATMGGIPQSISLIDKMPPIRDQGDLGACTAFSCEAPAWVAQANPKDPATQPRSISPLFQYYVERMIENSVGVDSGAAIPDIFRGMNQYGICDEKLWPYDTSKFKIKPPDTAFKSAAERRAHIYAPVPQATQNILGCLAHGFPMAFGISVYGSFELVGKNGLIPMPGASEKNLGGHAIDVIGMNATANEDATGIPPMHAMIRNSWNTDWGKDGYAFMPMDYILDPQLASDFWMIRVLQ